MDTIDSRGTIVVGVDGSAEAHAALTWAVATADRLDAQVLAVAVWEMPLAVGPEPMQPVMPVDGPEATETARLILTEALAALGPADRSRVEGHAVVGEAGRTLVEYAEKAELLVLGSTGRGPVARALTGSISAHCARHAPCPVVLVPAPEG